MIIDTALKALTPIIKSIFPDKAQQDEALLQLVQSVQKGEQGVITAQAGIITSEATGSSWLQRNWRPVLMMVCIFIVANNYIIAPYVSVMFGIDVRVPLDDNIWNLMNLGVGGYIAGRSGEKIMKLYKGS